MGLSKKKILEKKIYFIYKNNKVKKWNLNLEQAEFLVMHASSFVMHPRSNNIKTSFLKKNVNLNKSLFNCQPREYIIPSFLFCIECKIHNENELKSFICNSMYYLGPIFLTKDVILKNSISSIIMDLKLAELYQLEVVVGFVKYLTVVKKKKN